MGDFNTKLRKSAGGFLYTFVATAEGTELFRFEASRLQHTRGGLLADVAVFSNISTALTVPSPRSGFITRATMDLLSARNKSDFATELQQRIPAPPGQAGIDWKRTVEEFATAVLDSDAERPKVLDLSAIEATTGEIPYLVPYLLPEGKPTILYGAGGTGKSILAMALAAAVQTGCAVLGWPATARNVLYLDWETDAADLALRNRLVSEGLGLSEPAPIRYMNLKTPITDHNTLAVVADAVTEFDIGLVVIDSVVMASPSSDQKDPAVGAKDFFSATSILGTTVLAIDHLAGDDMKKPGSVTKPYGSVFKWNIARNVFELRYIEKDDNLVLKHRKSNIGPRMNDKVMSLVWDGFGLGGTHFDLGSGELYKMPIGTRILEAMKAGHDVRTIDKVLNEDDAYDPVNTVDVKASVQSLMQQGLLFNDEGEVVLTYKALGLDENGNTR